MVIFTIEVNELILPTHRLQEDGTFRELEREGFEIKPGDKIFNDYNAAANWKKNRKEVKVGDTKIDNSDLHIFGTPSINIRQHRTTKPKKSYFSKTEVETILRKGNDERNNFLVVDYDGDVHLIPHGNQREGYAVRYETFQAGNGYVGPKSRLNHLDNTYNALLEGWIEHLETGDGEYRDYCEGKLTIEELQQEAESIVSRMSF